MLDYSVAGFIGAYTLFSQPPVPVSAPASAPAFHPAAISYAAPETFARHVGTHHARAHSAHPKAHHLKTKTKLNKDFLAF
jgi:hypothetical protein